MATSSKRTSKTGAQAGVGIAAKTGQVDKVAAGGKAGRAGSGVTTGINTGLATGAGSTVGLRPDISVQLPPGLFAPDVVGNLFKTSRPGRPVVRPDDLLALRVQLVNLKVTPGTPPKLERSGTAAAYLILHHPPQAIAEEVFYESPMPGVTIANTDIPPGKPPPSAPADNNVDPPPIRARAAGESRIAFEWPQGFSCDYTLAGVLEAVQSLVMRVPAAARPRSSRFVGVWADIATFASAVLAFTSAKKARAKAAKPARTAKAARPAKDTTAAFSTTTPIARAIGSFGLRQAGIAMRGGPAAQATLRRRASDFVASLSPAGTWGLEAANVQPILRVRPRPAPPLPNQTALELPWRLIISPHAGESWRHSPQAVTSPGTKRTELWHTRLVGNGSAAKPPIEPPHADPTRTVRAVWATTSDVWGKPMQSAFPSAAQLPLPGQGDPFLPTLNDYDRYQISHLSANFQPTNYVPQPIDTNLLMLSALGGWLDSRGDWEPPGLDLESWVHRASMGRDHYVRVVYRGKCFPFGHRAVIIKVSERKFHSALPGNPAYLRQKMFLVVRQRVRDFDDAGQLKPYGPNNQRCRNEFPFTQVRMLTTVTPNLAQPKETDIAGQDLKLFWPALSKDDLFKFRFSATDLDGRNVEFEMPLIFMSNSLASPRFLSGGKLVPLYNEAQAPGEGLLGAAEAAKLALDDWLAKQTHPDFTEPSADDPTWAPMKRQRIAFAPSVKAGDTAVETITLTFGAHIPDPNNTTSLNAFKSFSDGLTRPMFFPRVVQCQARIGALAQLSGSEKYNLLRWNAKYAEFGFDGVQNKGEVFVDVVNTPDMAKLDFSKQGDRSGGFVMPNLNPSAISRALGPAAGDTAELLKGKVVPNQFFPADGPLTDLPLPLLFGCIPLSAVITQLDNLMGDLGKAPKFASEASTKVESFFGDLMRLYQFVTSLAEQPASLGAAALEVVRGMLTDIVQQASAFTAAQLQAVNQKVTAVLAQLDAVHAQLQALKTKGFGGGNPLDDAAIDLGAALDAPQGNGALRAALNDLRATVNGLPVPAGFKQTVNNTTAGAITLLDGLQSIVALYGHGKLLFDALQGLLDNSAPGQSLGELIAKPGELAPKIQLVADRLGDVRNDVAAFPLLEGPPRKALLEAVDAVQAALGTVADLLKLLESLLGEELVIRFDWKPEIKSWGFDPAEPLFVVHDKHAFIVAVEARVKKSGGPPKIQVLCGLHHFDLVLIAPASFIELNFEKIEFSVDSNAKMNVDVLLSDIKFVGPLSFVEVLKDLIPLDGFSDPPYLDITPQGIDAGFDIALPSITCGVLNLSNLSLGAGFTVPFIGQPLSVRFNFCTREQPFHLTVWCFGGGGFFGITLDPKGIQILEAAFEFGAAISIDFGVASGGVSVMAGIYFRMEQTACSLTGYFRLEGHVDVLGLITASLELYLELRYEFETGKCVGRAELTIEIEVFVFSGSVTISCEKKFAGSNGDPTLRMLMGVSKDPALPLADELALISDDTVYAWRDYCEAFA